MIISKRTASIRKEVSRAALPACCLLLGVFGASIVNAQVTFKANNTDSLNQASSWVDGIVPDETIIGVWDSTVVGANSVSTGADLSWLGIRIDDPGGQVSISGSELSLGAGGIDLSNATQDLMFQGPVHFAAPQKVQVAANRTIQIFGDVSWSNWWGLGFEIEEGGQVTGGGLGDATFIITAGGAEGMAVGTVNRLDFAALDGANNVVAAQDVPEIFEFDVTENPPGDPENPEAIPTIPSGGGERIFYMDFVDDSVPGVLSGGGNAGIRNSRFNAPNTNFDQWIVNLGGSGHTITIASILVTENVGDTDIHFGGPGWIRISGTGPGLNVFQYNTQGDVIIAPQNSISERAGPRSLNKMGPGRLILDGPGTYTGGTFVHEGILEIRDVITSNNVMEVAGEATLQLVNSDMTISHLNVAEGGVVTGRGSMAASGQVLEATNRGDLVLDGRFDTMTITGDFVNYGTITVSDDAFLTIEGTLTNFGTIDYSGGYATFPEGDDFVNEGTVVEGEPGPRPLPADFFVRYENIFAIDGEFSVTLNTFAGLDYTFERSANLIEPTTEPFVTTTLDGEGADSTVANDGQRGPDTNWGGSTTMWIRNFDGTREQAAIMRFDLSEMPEDAVLDQAILQYFYTGANRDRTFEIWGLTDESLDDWDEMEVTYNNFGGFVAPLDLGFKEVDESAMTFLGFYAFIQTEPFFSSEGSLFRFEGEGEDQVQVPADFGDFLASDTNGVVTFVVIMTGTDNNASYSIASSSHPDLGTFDAITGVEIIPPTLIIPTEESLNDPGEPWIQVGSPQTGLGDPLTFTDGIGGAGSGFYRFIVSE